MEVKGGIIKDCKVEMCKLCNYSIVTMNI